MTSSAALHVAHGTGLPVPRRKIPIGQRPRKQGAHWYDGWKNLPDEAPAPAPVGKRVTPKEKTKPARTIRVSAELDPETTVREYLVENLSLEAIGKRHDAGKDRVRGVLIRAGVTLRDQGGRPGTKTRIWTDDEATRARHLYEVEGYGLKRVAACFGTGQRQIERMFAERGIETRPHGGQKK